MSLQEHAPWSNPVHEKNKNIDQSIALVKSTNEYLKYLVDQIRNYCDSLQAHLNGPEVSISAENTSLTADYITKRANQAGIIHLHQNSSPQCRD